MNVKEQAIKVEQLKQERDEAHNTLFAERLSVSREIDNITHQMFVLGDKRQKLQQKLNELTEKEKRNADHYNLLIKAVTSIGGKPTQ